MFFLFSADKGMKNTDITENITKNMSFCFQSKFFRSEFIGILGGFSKIASK